jgi:CDP-paratose 2-epimerase
MVEFPRAPRSAAVYNMGGGRASNCSMLEAIAMCEEIAGRELAWELVERPRMGDHRWWISDTSEFEADYPEWRLTYDVPAILREIFERNVEAWSARV